MIAQHIIAQLTALSDEERHRVMREVKDHFDQLYIQASNERHRQRVRSVRVEALGGDRYKLVHANGTVIAKSRKLIRFGKPALISWLISAEDGRLLGEFDCELLMNVRARVAAVMEELRP